MMRLPFKDDDDYFTKNVNSAFETIRFTYLEAIKPQLMMNKVNVMLDDGSIIEIQKELTQIADNATKTFRSIASKGNDILYKELEKIGYAKLGFEELFAKLFEDRRLVEDLERKASSVEGEFPEFEEMHNKKIHLFAELNNLLIQLYQISPVSIDYNKLMQGEEGVVTYFDIEIIKNQKTRERDSYINTKRISREVSKQIIIKLNEVAKTLQKIR